MIVVLLLRPVLFFDIINFTNSPICFCFFEASVTWILPNGNSVLPSNMYMILIHSGGDSSDIVLGYSCDSRSGCNAA